MKNWTVMRTLLIGATIAGILDILFAICFANYNGVAPQQLLQTVASGALGKTAFSGGISTAALGLIFHFALSYLWASIFLVTAWRVPSLTYHPLVSGIGFGIIVFLAMRLVVLPLSAFPFPVKFKLLSSSLDLLSHMFLFGVPIAFATSKALRARLTLQSR
jgi:uncharacterized membrane protein YagU involved in acid resistance